VLIQSIAKFKAMAGLPTMLLISCHIYWEAYLLSTSFTWFSFDFTSVLVHFVSYTSDILEAKHMFAKVATSKKEAKQTSKYYDVCCICNEPNGILQTNYYHMYTLLGKRSECVKST